MFDSRRLQEMREAIRSMTDEEMDEIMAELQREGIIDENWRVLKRAPEPPKEAANGKKKSTRPRKNSRRPTRG